MALGKTTERICEALREMIADGRLPGGIRLKEMELAEKFDASRTPIHEALMQLQSEGLVVRLPNSGAVIRALDERDVEDAFQLRALLEGYGAALAAVRLSQAQIRELERLCEEMEGPRGQGQDQTTVAYLLERNAEFHRIILEASDNRRLIVALRTIMEIPRVYKSYYWHDERERQRSFLYHRELIEAFRNRDSLWAEATMKIHIHAVRDYLLTKLQKDRRERLHPA
jgi:DNA-binding GntR family transcriptional regulator